MALHNKLYLINILIFSLVVSNEVIAQNKKIIYEVYPHVQNIDSLILGGTMAYNNYDSIPQLDLESLLYKIDLELTNLNDKLFLKKKLSRRSYRLWREYISSVQLLKLKLKRIGYLAVTSDAQFKFVKNYTNAIAEIDKKYKRKYIRHVLSQE